MSRPIDHLDPFEDEQGIRGLLDAEANAPAPSADAEARIWQRVSGAMVAPPPPAWHGPAIVVSALAIGLVAGWLLLRGMLIAPPPPSAPVVVVVPPPVPSIGAIAPTVSAAPAASMSPAPLQFSPERLRLAAPRAVEPDTLAAERALVERAREALAHGDPKAAESALVEHQRRFPEGQLREERESLAIRALLTTGRARDAHLRAASFLRRDPDSLFAPVVRALADRARTLSAPATGPTEVDDE